MSEHIVHAYCLHCARRAGREPHMGESYDTLCGTTSVRREVHDPDSIPANACPACVTAECEQCGPVAAPAPLVDVAMHGSSVKTAPLTESDRAELADAEVAPNTSDYDPGELLAAIERIVARHRAEAWDEGRNATWTHIGLRRGLAPDNPYARD